MKIVVKVAPSRCADAEKIVTDLVRRVLPEEELDAVSVEPVFPDVRTGRRAGMMMLSLAGKTSSRDVARVLESLRASDDVEYAQEPSARTPQASTRGRS